MTETTGKGKRDSGHLYVPELKDLYRQGRVSRREFLRNACLLGLSFAGASAFLAACGPTPVPTATERPAEGPTVTVPQQHFRPSSRAIPRRGGTMTIASSVPHLDHPARLISIAGANQVRQVCENLTFTDKDNVTTPWLLDGWEPNETLDEWTLYLRQGIRFNNGEELTADDLIFNFEQWLSEDIGSPMLALIGRYLSGENIERVSDHAVRLYLTSPQIALPEQLSHFSAMIVPKTFEGDLTEQPIGTGPFLLEDFVETQWALFTRRDDYWRAGDDQKPLPYLDKLSYLDLGEDEAAWISALESGRVDSVFDPGCDPSQVANDLPGIRAYSVPSANTFVIRMRVDKEPWTDNRVRQALKKCIDRQRMLDLSSFGHGVLAHDAHVAPVHPEYCAKPIPEHDPGDAKRLLEEAGLTPPIQVELWTQEACTEPEMARVLKETAAPGGFDIRISAIPSAQFWDLWSEVPLGITHWAHHPLGTMVLSLAYAADDRGKPVRLNETQWVDDEFNDLLEQAEGTLEVEARREMMCRLEEIQMERGSVGIAFWTNAWVIANEKIRNVDAHPSGYDILLEAWRDEV